LVVRVTKLNVTSNLQTFALILTAEPYFSVTQPSDVVVMESEVRSDTRGSVEKVEAKFDLLKRGLYESDINPADLQPIEGRFQNSAGTLAREAVQTAEDARVISAIQCACRQSVPSERPGTIRHSTSSV
jgi:hypothetical protein